MDSAWKMYRSATSYIATQLFKSLSIVDKLELIKSASIEDKLEIVTVMIEDLDKQQSEVKLFSVDAKGAKKPYNNHASQTEWDNWASFPHSKSDLSLVQAEMNVAMTETKKLADDELPSEQQVRGFIEFMTNLHMTEEYEAEHMYNQPLIKSHMDAMLIEKFVSTMNTQFGGLTQQQYERVNDSVLRSFNDQAKRHDEHMDLFLERAFNAGSVSFPEDVDEELKEEWARQDELERNECLQSMGYLADDDSH